MSDKQNASRSAKNGSSPAPISKDELQQEMQAALNNGQPRARRKKAQTTEQPVSRGQQAETNARTSGDAKAEKLRQIKASVASASQGIYTDETNSATAAEAQRYVRRRNGNTTNQPQTGNNRPKQTKQTRQPAQSTKQTRQRPVPQQTRYEEETTASGSKVGKIVSIAALVLVLLLLIAYLIGYFSYRNELLPNTYVNQIDVGGMTVSEAENKIIESASANGITFTKKSGEKVHFEGSDFGSTVTLPENSLQAAADESHVLWFTKLMHRTDYSVSLINSYSESALSNLVLSNSWGTTPPTDAYIQKGSDGTYSIVPEDNGDMVDATVLMNYTIEQMREGNNDIDMTAADCYLEADVKSEDLTSALEACNALSGLTITYDFDDRQEVLDTSTIADWLSADTDGNITVDRDSAETWVRDHLVKYDTYVAGYTRTFRSTLQGVLELPLGDYGTYGWKTDVDSTVDELVDYLTAGESVTIEPVYSKEGYCRATDDIGDSYAEVDITNQKVFLYKDGELVLEADCVTGLATDPDRATPPGIYQVWDKERNITLGTYAVQGYEQPVDYWVNFTELGIGFHDLSRSAYGGEIYKTNGSHGCINMKLEDVAKLYDIVEIGYPVIVIA